MSVALREMEMTVHSDLNSVETEDGKLWETVCEFDDLFPNIGVRALVQGRQVAIFKFNNELFAIDAFDPFSEAAVLSRGIVGDLRGELVVASPIYKQHFSLKTGICQEDNSVKVPVYAVRVVDGKVQIARPD